MTDSNEQIEPTDTTGAQEAPTAPTPTTGAPAPQDSASNQQVESALTLEAAQKELERARKEAAKYRTQLREREEADAKAAEEKRQAELTAEQRAAEAEAKAQEAIKAAEERVAQAERRAALTGVVADANAALKLLDPEVHLNDDGTVNTTALLESYPFLAPTPATPAGKTPAGGAGGTAPKPASISDVANMTPDEYEKHRAEIFASLRK